MQEPSLLSIIEMMQSAMPDLNVVETTDHKAYLRAIKQMKHLKNGVVTTKVDGVELLRYPYLDVEFNLKPGATKLGVTGKMRRVEKFWEIIEQPGLHVQKVKRKPSF